MANYYAVFGVLQLIFYNVKIVYIIIIFFVNVQSIINARGTGNEGR